MDMNLHPMICDLCIDETNMIAYVVPHLDNPNLFDLELLCTSCGFTIYTHKKKGMSKAEYEQEVSQLYRYVPIW